MKLISRFLKPSNESFFLFGPRGTGKSLWVKENFKDSIYIDLLEPENIRMYSSKPERLKNVVYGNPEKRDIVIDEIQKIPELLSVIHLLMEENKNLRFIMTGSSSRKLKRFNADLLAGRALNISMHPFLPAELGADFSFEKAIKYGLIPLIYFSSTPDAKLKSYCFLYIKEEIQMEALVRNISSFNRFLEVISFSHASLLNTSSVGREAQVERKTVEGYIKILEDLLLCFQLNVFSKKAKRNLVSHRKFYFSDVGVFNYLRPKGPFDRVEEIGGAAFEGLVAQTLRAWIDYSEHQDQIFFWRSKSGLEVDFIIYGEDGIFAIEVKNSDGVKNEHLRSLKEFAKDYHQAVCILIYRGKEKLKFGNIFCLPAEDFLLKLQPKMPLKQILFL